MESGRDRKAAPVFVCGLGEVCRQEGLSCSHWRPSKPQEACVPAKAGTQTGHPPSRVNKPQGRWCIWVLVPLTRGHCPLHPHHHPGEGRGPIGKVAIIKRHPQLARSPNWTPAFAGVVAIGTRAPCHPKPNPVTPAKAGVPHVTRDTRQTGRSQLSLGRRWSGEAAPAPDYHTPPHARPHDHCPPAPNRRYPVI